MSLEARSGNKTLLKLLLEKTTEEYRDQQIQGSVTSQNPTFLYTKIYIVILYTISMNTTITTKIPSQTMKELFLRNFFNNLEN